MGGKLAALQGLGANGSDATTFINHSLEILDKIAFYKGQEKITSVEYYTAIEDLKIQMSALQSLQQGVARKETDFATSGDSSNPKVSSKVQNLSQKIEALHQLPTTPPTNDGPNSQTFIPKFVTLARKIIVAHEQEEIDLTEHNHLMNSLRDQMWRRFGFSPVANA